MREMYRDVPFEDSKCGSLRSNRGEHPLVDRITLGERSILVCRVCGQELANTPSKSLLVEAQNDNITNRSGSGPGVTGTDEKG